MPLNESLARTGAVSERRGEIDLKKVAAVLGGTTDPPITVARALAREKTLGKSPDPLRKWQDSRKQVAAGCIAAAGDKMKRLNFVVPLPDLSVREGEAAQRTPFPDRWLRVRRLAPGLHSSPTAQGAKGPEPGRARPSVKNLSGLVRFAET